MTEPVLAVSVPGRGRHYKHPATGRLLPSVTNILDMLAKPWLAGWMAKQVAGYAWDNRMALLEIDDREAAVDFLKGAGRRRRDAAASLGDVLHRLAEARVKGEPDPPIDDAAAPFVASWEAFVRDWQPEWVATEITMFRRDLVYSYAGTADFIARIGGQLVLGDYKTGSDVYEEHVLQLAALRFCDEVWEPSTGKLSRAPIIDRCIVVHIRPEGYKVREVEADQDAHAAFLGLHHVWWWMHELATHAIGPELTPERFKRASSGAADGGVAAESPPAAPVPIPGGSGPLAASQDADGTLLASDTAPDEPVSAGTPGAADPSVTGGSGV